jgi:glycosyltransferase involved in cell wall biosynthesis
MIPSSCQNDATPHPLRVTCLLPAFNEAPRIGQVLEVVTGHPLIDEVIVIDDGSTDATANIAARKGVTVVMLGKNGGKARALAAGVARARGDILVLLDSDLIGLTRHDVTRLIAPVLNGRAQTTLSLRGNAPRLWRWIGLDYISGERVLPRAMLAAHLDRLHGMQRFGIEVFLNSLWIAAQSRIVVVPWPDVQSPSKAAKHGLWRGILGDLGMMADILRTISAPQIIQQIRHLRAQRLLS